MKYNLSEEQFYKLWGLDERYYYYKSSFAVKCRKRVWNIKYKDKFKLKYHERSTQGSFAYLEGKPSHINFFLLQL